MTAESNPWSPPQRTGTLSLPLLVQTVAFPPKETEHDSDTCYSLQPSHLCIFDFSTNSLCLFWQLEHHRWIVSSVSFIVALRRAVDLSSCWLPFTSTTSKSVISSMVLHGPVHRQKHPSLLHRQVHRCCQPRAALTKLTFILPVPSQICTSLSLQSKPLMITTPFTEPWSPTFPQTSPT